MLFLFFPVRTDAPVYHFPYATLGLIAVNTAVFVLTFVMPIMFGVGEYEYWTDALCATLGGAIQPLSWFTANFYHFDPGHLIFNMLFLWTFGLIVEGKLGPLKFLAVCLLIGILGGATIQMTFYGLETSTWGGGASVMISGLMLIAVLWAPKNEIGLAYFLWVLFYIRLGVWDVAVSSFIMFYLFLQGTSAVLQGTFLTSEFMHLVGAVFGTIIGFGMLRWKMVDCERWDLISVMRGEHGRQLKRAIYNEVDESLGPSASVKKKIRKKRREALSRREAAKAGKGGDADKAVSPTDRAIARIHSLLKQKKARAALQLLLERQRIDPKFQIPGPDLLRLAQQLYEAKRTNESVGFLTEYLERFPDGADRIRLRTAGLMIVEQKRPSAALRVLNPVVTSALSDKERDEYARLLREANALIADGVIEFGDGAW